MPGLSLRSGFATSSTTGYVTTFWTVWGERRICETAPRNGWSGKASTENVASWPTFTRPTSASSMFVRTCIFVRSCAIVKMTGAWKDAATVWPTSYCRSTTTPSMGDMIFAYDEVRLAPA